MTPLTASEGLDVLHCAVSTPGAPMAFGVVLSVYFVCRGDDKALVWMCGNWGPPLLPSRHL